MEFDSLINHAYAEKIKIGKKNTNSYTVGK